MGCYKIVNSFRLRNRVLDVPRCLACNSEMLEGSIQPVPVADETVSAPYFSKILI